MIAKIEQLNSVQWNAISSKQLAWAGKNCVSYGKDFAWHMGHREGHENILRVTFSL